jgi:TRAP-type transport system periplasmic protein
MKRRIRLLAIAGILMLVVVPLHQAKAADQPGSKTLKLSTLYSEGKELYETVLFFANEVEKRTGGKIKFKIFPGNSLVSENQALTAVHTGVVDSAFVPAAYEQSLWPLTGMTMTFGAPNISYEKWSSIHDQVREIINKNLNINVVILGMPHVLNYFYYSKKPVKGKLSDFDRSLVRSAGGAYDASFEALGCAPVKIGASEVYMAMQKGTIDSGWNIYSRYIEGKLYEVAPHVIIVPKGMVISGQHFVINRSVWESVGPEFQKVLLQVGTEIVTFTNQRSAKSDQQVINDALPKLNIKPVVMDDAENNLLIKRLQKVWDPLIAKLGKPAEEIAKIIGVRQ